MSEYPIRVEKSEAIYGHWENGDGDMAELAIGLYDLTAHYKALWDDYHADRAALVRYVRAQRNYLGERYLDRAPHFIVTEHEEAYEALSQELRDEIEDGGEKTDQS